MSDPNVAPDPDEGDFPEAGDSDGIQPEEPTPEATEDEDSGQLADEDEPDNPIDGPVVEGTVLDAADGFADLADLRVAADAVSAQRWSANPTVILAVSKMPGGVGYLQAVVRVAGVKNSKGNWAPLYVMAQAINGDRDTRFLLFRANGTYAGSWMIVKGGGHGSSFHAYRSAAGRLYIWTWIKKKAYRIRWQGGKSVRSGTKTDFKGRRPVGSYEPYIGMRSGHDNYEILSLHNRHNLLAGSTKPIREVRLPKRPGTQLQAWAVGRDRVYRIMGKTGFPAGNGRHLLETFDWNGKLLVPTQVGGMHVRATSDEPQSITFSGKPGELMVGKRSGGSKPRRSYPLWTMRDLT